MKSKFFIGATAALLLGACSQDEVMSVRQDGINYSVTTPNLTRAADSYCNEILPNSFKVWAATSDGDLYINGDVIANNSGNWVDQSGTRYWPNEGTLDFYAQVNGDQEFAFNSGAPTFNNFTVKQAVEEQVDLMYAVSKGLGKEDITVALNFRHALSQVCFRAKNSTKNLSVEIKGVSVGHLTNGGTFTFPTTDTNENYEHPQHGDEADPDAPTLNGGTWALNADYDTQYDVALDKAVTVGPNSEVVNLTCPGDNHANGFEKVLTLMPQEVAAWNPQQPAATFNGAYFLIDLVITNLADAEAETAAEVLYEGKAAVPVSVDWQQGYRYIYTFVFDEGGNGGWTPDPEDPQPVLATIKWDVSVDDFIPAYPDGGESDGTHMDTDNDGGEQGGGDDDDDDPATSYTLTFDGNMPDDAQDGSVSNLPEALTGNYTYTIPSNEPSCGENYEFLGWSNNPNAEEPDYETGDGITLSGNLTLYAVWQKLTYMGGGAGSEGGLDDK